MDMFPVVCALLSFVLIGPGPSDAKQITLKIASGLKGERLNFKATCKGPCQEVSVTVTALSGFLHLYASNDSLPHPGYCDDCFCRVKNVCRNITFQGSSSFDISVVAYTDFVNATLTVEALNLDQITKITLPSQRLNLGSATKGEKRNFRVTCSGPCKQVSANVRGRSGSPFLHGANALVPRVDDNFRCKDCFCESVVTWGLNICQYISLEDSSSFTLTVTAGTTYQDAFLTVEAVNFKNIEEVQIPFKLLKLGAPSYNRKVERRNFYATCNGPCNSVRVTAISGNPEVFVAKKSIPFLYWYEVRWRGQPRCRNCLKNYNLVNFVDSSSFAFSVVTTKSSDIKVEAYNLRDVEEKIFPTKIISLGTYGGWTKKQFRFDCHGPCKGVSVEGTSTTIPINWFLDVQHQPAWACPNCECKRKHNLDPNNCLHRNFDSDSFSVLTYAMRDVLKNITLIVQAFNLKV